MADYLGGKIRLDISELQASITQANKLIRENEATWRQSASQLDDWTKSEEGLTSRVDLLTNRIAKQREILETLKKKKEETIKIYGKESKEVDAVNKEIEKYGKSLDSSIKEQDATKKSLDNLNKSTDKQTTSLQKMDKAVVSVNQGFTIAKGLVVNFATAIVKSAVQSVQAFINAVQSLPESTKALRLELSQLEQSFNKAGFTTEEARESYVDFTGVLGDVSGNISSSLSVIASLSKSNKDLGTWVTALTGIYAQFGKTLPIEELIKNAQETTNTGKLTENLRKALLNANIDAEKFEETLGGINTKQERSSYILATLYQAYGDIGREYRELNSQAIRATVAQTEYEIALSNFGKVLEPIKTQFTEIKTSILNSLWGIVNGVDEAKGELAYSVGYLFGTLAKLLESVKDIFLPIWEDIKEAFQNWWDENAPEMKKQVKAFFYNCFPMDTVDTVIDIVSKACQPIRDLFDDIEAGNWAAVIGDVLPIISIKVGLDLLTKGINDLPSKIATGLSSAFSTSGITMGGAVAGAIGVITIALGLKNAIETGDYTGFAADVVAGVLAGLTVAGLTGSVTGGVIAFSVVANLKIGTKIKDDIEAEGKAMAEEFNKATAEIEKTIEDIREKATEVKNELLSDFLENAPTEIIKKARDEVINYFDKDFADTYWDMLQRLVDFGHTSAVQIAKEIAAGFGIGLDDMSKVSEEEAEKVVKAIKDVLGIHSPSVVGEDIGEMFALGFSNGYAGLPFMLKKTTQEAVEEVQTVVVQVSNGGLAKSKAGYGTQQVYPAQSVFKDEAERLAAAEEEKRKKEEEARKRAERDARRYNFINNVKSGLKEYVEIIESGVKEISSTISSGLKNALKNDDFSNLASDFVTGLQSSIGSFISSKSGFLGGLFDIATLLVDRDDADEIITAIGDNLEQAFNKIIDNLPKIVKIISKLMKTILQALVKAIPLLIEEIPSIVSEIVKAFIENLPSFLEIGVQIIKGILEGMWEAVQNIGNVIAQIGERIVGGLRDWFGIRSPSRKMKNEVGKYMALGVAEGFKENIGAINESIKGVDTSLGGATSRGFSSTKTIVNQYNTYAREHSAFELYKSERKIKQLVGAY